MYDNQLGVLCVFKVSERNSGRNAVTCSDLVGFFKVECHNYNPNLSFSFESPSFVASKSKIAPSANGTNNVSCFYDTYTRIFHSFRAK